MTDALIAVTVRRRRSPALSRRCGSTGDGGGTGAGSLRIALDSSCATFLMPRSVETAARPAKPSEKLATSSSVTLCQTGRIFFLLPLLLAISPSSSYCVQLFRKKLGLRITTPNRELRSPRSIIARRESPILISVSSSQTRNPRLSSCRASGRATPSLSSRAWLMNTSCPSGGNFAGGKGGEVSVT